MTADLVLFLGARMSLYYLFGDLFNPEAKIIQVDICQSGECGAGEFGRLYSTGAVKEMQRTLTVRAGRNRQLCLIIFATFRGTYD